MVTTILAFPLQKNRYSKKVGAERKKEQKLVVEIKQENPRR